MKRPLIRYHGGKWKLAPWIISLMPKHRVYVEPYGGAASVLLRKPRCYAEIYNDLDDEIVSLFRVCREQGEDLKRVLALTPFSRTDYLEAWLEADNALEQARRTVIRAYMGFGSAAATKARSANQKRGGLAQTGFRSNSNRSGTTPAHDWANFPKHLDAIIERLQGVVIECRDATVIMETHDCEDCLHFVDPPYVSDTRDAGGDYRHEMTDTQHVALAQTLSNLKGMVMLCGYPSNLYLSLYAGWKFKDCKAFADGARERVERIWFNDAAFAGIAQGDMFA